MDKTTAEKLVPEVANAFREELSQSEIETEHKENSRSLAYAVGYVMPIIGPLFGITSVYWYIATVIIVGAAGYYGFKDKPLAGLIGGIVMAVAFPFTFCFYFAGRDTMIRFEMLFPILLAFIPTWIIFTILSKVLYSDK